MGVEKAGGEGNVTEERMEGELREREGKEEEKIKGKGKSKSLGKGRMGGGS